LAWKSSSAKRQRATSAERAAARRLEDVRRARQPFERLSRRLIDDTLRRYLPEEGVVVEIGMGDGQLRERLPEAVLPRVIHTEPDAAVSRAYRRQNRQTSVIQAAAESLPFETASVAAVLGLCVLDVVPDGAVVVQELARVLRPGGRVVHWLDMTTVLDAVIDSLWSIGLVPVPNCFTDPSAQAWPEDLWLIPRGQLALVVRALHEGGSPAARPLREYLATFSRAPTAPGAPTAELIQLQERPELRVALRTAFQTAFELAAPDVRAELGRFVGQPLSSAQLFEAKLRSWFSEQAGFRIEHCGLDRAWETTGLQGQDLVYRSCFVGEQRHLPHIPDVPLCLDAKLDLHQETLVELGVFSFVATRMGY